MIAIVGAKGGCGKTVTTLGLAEAFGRAGVATLAVDADRQLPNLHVVAGVDRNPTMSALDEGRSVTELAHSHPQASGVGVLPAPATPTAEIEPLLSGLDAEAPVVLVDCPSGAGPDAIEPMRVASDALVVTTSTERSLASAERTIEIARRLEVTILGAIVTRCDAVARDVETRLDVPVVGIVPERTSPLTSESVHRVYDEVVAELMARGAVADTPPPSPPGTRISLGIDALDERLEGGVPDGSLVALVADPASQSEHLLYRSTAIRRSLVLATGPGVARVERGLSRSTTETGNPTVRRLSGTEVFVDATALVEKLPPETTLVVDSIDAFEEASRDEYVEFLGILGDVLRQTRSIALVHCLDRECGSGNRGVTKRFADVVCEFRTHPPRGDDEPMPHLSITKSRFSYDAVGTVVLDADAFEADAE